MDKTEHEWRERLTPEEYHVLREKGTEVPHSGAFLHKNEAGEYTCKACGNHLFDSATKFDSKSGWPSFYDALPGAVKCNRDDSHGVLRTEIICARCGSHLGHIFEDAYDQPTGQRYCINSVALGFTPKKQP